MSENTKTSASTASDYRTLITEALMPASLHRITANASCIPWLPVRDGRYEISVRASWSSSAIEQNSDARGPAAHFGDDATPVSQPWASSGTKLAHSEARTDGKSARLSSG
ncbi:hypothetical protein [Bradyrhizobium diazoefficiens]|uniref:hypothetical protein n=1 Tax=Bradyrhizobium diazoefficiens TaxID=1355477 RepID=UPI00271560AD|nr:hypothetical protein [Bradyrhizobium diazoefficiens]WLA53929.1 hypothetical protein QIH81_25600 [Bradyrhizobium diazoefficiens]